MEILNFKNMNLSDEIKRALADMGFEEATPIQAQSIPHILEGKDVLGQAHTGTGKTCAFGIPAVQMIEENHEGVQILVLCPTRELAIQSSEELKAVAKYKPDIRVLPVYGGQEIERQISALRKRPQIIIGTPGRLMDHMRRHTIKLAGLKMIVLDEADEMLNMGFREDIDTILSKVPEDVQTILFSATMSKEIREITANYQHSPIHVTIEHQVLTVPKIEQFYLEVANANRLEVLSRLIDAHHIRLGLVFCNTRKQVDELTESLQARGYSAEALHGEMRQERRDRVMAQFRKGQIDILVATDVAARGIDVDDIEAVFNYDLPNDEEYYVHRIGRTGRAGRAGKAFSFVYGREMGKLKEILRFTRTSITLIQPPAFTDVEETKSGKLIKSIRSTLTEGQLTPYIHAIEEILEDLNAQSAEEQFVTTLDVAAVLLKQMTSVDQPKFEHPRTDRSNRPARHDYQKASHFKNQDSYGRRGSYRGSSKRKRDNR